MKVLLLSPPYIAEYMRNGRCDYVSWSHTQWYPIWLAYCGALLEKQGHRVELLDAPAEGLSYKDTFDKVRNFSPELLVVYSSTKSQQSDISFSERLKEKIGSYVVFVGPYISNNAEMLLRHSAKIDAAVQGEFEYPVLELANGVEKNKIKNLVWKENGEIVFNGNRPLLSGEELNKLPFVTAFYREHLNLKNYKVPSELYPFVDLFTGRGCFWGRCAFCLWPSSFIKGGQYNTRSIDNVIEELKFVKREMPYVKEVFFQDDSLPKGRAIELSRAILDNGLNIIWGCYVRGDFDYDTLRLMQESGCRALHVGYESKSNLILENICKGLTWEEMTEFTMNAHKAGLRIHGDFLFGLPGETEDTIKETISWAVMLNPGTAQFLSINLYPDTGVYKYLLQNGHIREGKANYPELSSAKIDNLIKMAYRRFYIRPAFFKKTITHPGEYIFSQGQTIARMVFNIFCRKSKN